MNKKEAIKRRYIIGGILILCVFVFPKLIWSISDIINKRDIIIQREDELKKVQAENERLKHSIEEAKTVEFVEREARNKLGLARKEETVIIMDKPQNESQSDNNAMEIKSPMWVAWWKLFF